MSKKQKTSQQGVFNQAGMSAYNQMTPMASQALRGNISDPYSNMFFNGQVGMLNQQIGAMGSSGMSALNQGLQANGMQANSPMAMFMQRQQANNTRSQQAQGYNNLLLNAANLRQQSIASALNYRPLQTGQNTTQTMSGLGTWLPQAISTAIGLGTGAAMGGGGGGGLLSAMGNMGGSFGGNSMLSSFASAPPSYGNPGMPSVGSGASFTPGQGYWGGLLGQG